MLPVAFFSDTSAMIPNDYYLTSSSAMAAAIEEAASLVYDANSPLYQQTPRWTPPAPEKQAPAEKAAPVSAPVVAPAKEQSPEEMDMLW